MTTAVRIRWDPINEQQEGFVSSESPRVLFSGAFGAGKSIALCAKALKLSLDYPGNFGYICRKVRATIVNSTLKTFKDLVCPRELIADENKTMGTIKLTNGSELMFGGLDDFLKLGSLGAGGIGFVGIDEAIETVEDDWTMLEGRLRLPGVPHQIFAATNPGPPSHYLYKMFFQGGMGDVYQATTLDNPSLPQDYIDRMTELEGIYRDRYVLGLWKGLEGLVYSNFREDICKIPRFPVPDSWPVYVGHDFGQVNPCALFYAQDPDTGMFYLWSTYIPDGGATVSTRVERFKEICAGRNVVRRVGGNQTTEDETRQAYTAHGWPISAPKIKHPAEQIERVKGMHGLNKIYVFNDQVDYLREKLSMAFDADKEKIKDESKYHCMAAERYLLSDFTPETVQKKKSGQVWRF